METNKKTLIAVVAIGVIQLVLLLLKTINVITWDWIWILTPLWGPYALFVVGGALLIICLFIFKLKERIFNKHG